MLSLAQAAKQVGKSKPTLLRAIRAGRLSATRRDDGTYAIDPAELLRAFPPLSEAVPDPMKQTVPRNGAGPEPGILSETVGLRALLAEREERIADMKARVADKDEVIADLRRRLDQATALLLTDQRPAKEGTLPPVTVWGRFRAWRRGR